MSKVKVSLTRRQDFRFKEKFIFPFWFTSDHSIDLSSKKCSSAVISIEKLTEKSKLEMKAAVKLGLIELDSNDNFDNSHTSVAA